MGELRAGLGGLQLQMQDGGWIEVCMDGGCGGGRGGRKKRGGEGGSDGCTAGALEQPSLSSILSLTHSLTRTFCSGLGGERGGKGKGKGQERPVRNCMEKRIALDPTGEAAN